VTSTVLNNYIAGEFLPSKKQFEDISPVDGSLGGYGSATLLAKVMHEAGVPAGLFNVVHGFGPELGIRGRVTSPGEHR